jgi:hypothetical protein
VNGPNRTTKEDLHPKLVLDNKDDKPADEKVFDEECDNEGHDSEKHADERPVDKDTSEKLTNDKKCFETSFHLCP